MAQLAGSYDLIVIGGGINGAAIARSAALAGLKVLLAERGDLGGGTSSASTKLAHGGLRYLEQGEFSLVRESLRERSILLRTAPHLVEPLEFVLEPVAGGRPWQVLRIGLWIYDLLAFGGALPRSRSLAAVHPAGRNRRELTYWDGRVDDSRLVVLNALDAAEQGAHVLTRTGVTAMHRADDRWHVTLADHGGGKFSAVSRFLVNAAGPWVGAVMRRIADLKEPPRLRLIRGSHLVLRRMLPDNRARLLQMRDGRVVFLIPYQRNFTLVGTTDIPVALPDECEPDEREVSYLLTAANGYFSGLASESDVAWRFGGIRALFDDGSIDASRISRDYHFEVDRERGLLSVIGGKITTARSLAERALTTMGLPAGATRQRPLPGGDIASLAALCDQVRSRWPFLGEERGLRMARAYGSRIDGLMAGAKSAADLGIDFGFGLTEREVRYLCDVEWARTAADVLWRRTKLGLLFTSGQADRLQRYMEDCSPAGSGGESAVPRSGIGSGTP